MPTVRDARPEDVPALASLLNEIVAIGGTTVRLEPMSEEAFLAHYVQGPGFISCVVAVDGDGAPCGFQAVERYPKLPPNWAGTGSFARHAPRVPGVGRAMFPATCARAAGITTLHAIIRSDNEPGLAYYAKMGFRQFDIMPGVPLSDSTPVDRIRTRFDMVSEPSASPGPAYPANDWSQNVASILLPSGSRTKQP